MNCTAIRCGADMILIDAGMAFPRNEGSELGVRVIVPDIAFLKENEKSIERHLFDAWTRRPCGSCVIYHQRAGFARLRESSYPRFGLCRDSKNASC